MSRRNFADILLGAGVDVFAEYKSLHTLAYQPGGFYSQVKASFLTIPFKGTAIDIDDFNARYGFRFEDLLVSSELDDLLSFCEYLLNFAYALLGGIGYYGSSVWAMKEHLELLIDKIGYKAVRYKGLYVLVSRDDDIEEAASVAPEEVSSDLIVYNYRGLIGDIESKRAILEKISLHLEPRRADLKRKSSELERDLFCLFNSLNIRHNNTHSSSDKNYKKVVSAMRDSEIEEWYDFVHEMSCAAFLLLDCCEWDQRLLELKKGL